MTEAPPNREVVRAGLERVRNLQQELMDELNGRRVEETTVETRAQDAPPPYETISEDRIGGV